MGLNSVPNSMKERLSLPCPPLALSEEIFSLEERGVYDEHGYWDEEVEIFWS
jgi:hypothetical protein